MCVLVKWCGVMLNVGVIESSFQDYISARLGAERQNRHRLQGS